MRSYKPEELFDEAGALRPELAELAPKGTRRMGDNPHANGGLLLHDLEMPDFRDFAVECPDARGHHRRIHQDHGRSSWPRPCAATWTRRTSGVFGPDETALATAWTPCST